MNPRMPATLLMLLAVWPISPARAGVAPATLPLSGLSAGLDAMRNGRFDEATGRFSTLAASDPADPVAPLLEGMAVWWRGQAGGRDAAAQVSVEERFAEAERRARAMAASQDAGPRTRGLTFLGISLMLDARARAARGSVFSAGSSAREGHRVLSEALRLSPDDPDALFAMGAYNYYADNVGVLIKGLRALLFIPGGNEDLGISQLEQSAERSQLFGTESLLLLSHIFSGGYEDDYRRADAYLARACARHEQSPLLLLMRADLVFRMGRLSEAERLSRQAAALARQTAAPQGAMMLEAAYRQAEALLVLRQPTQALDVIDAALAQAMPQDHEARQRWGALIYAVARDTDETGRAQAALQRVQEPDGSAPAPRRARAQGSAAPSNARRTAALRMASEGRGTAAIIELQQMAAAAPSDGRIAYDLGRLLQRAGRADEARPPLEVAARSPQSEVAGWALLRLGWDRERRGLRDEALPYYHKAGEMKRFAFKQAARDRERYPANIEPEG